MKTFLDINLLSIIYSVTLFLQTELWMNSYRINRIIDWGDIGKYTDLMIVLIYMLASVWVYFLTKRRLGKRKIKHVVAVSWIPYYVIFLFLFSSQFPITNPAEKPLPVVGLLTLSSWVIFPIYITSINIASSINWKNK